MSHIIDKRRRADLDLFILALIQSGVSTPYEFQKLAGISQGASIPALRRLVEAGHIKAGKAGARRRMSHRITRSGQGALTAGWDSLLQAGSSGEVEADLRIALLAVHIGKSRPAAMQFLRQSAAMKDAALLLQSDSVSRGEVSLLAKQYHALRQTLVKAALRAESRALIDLAKMLSRPVLGDASPKRPQRRRATGSQGVSKGL